MSGKRKSSETDSVVVALARLEEKHDAFTGETRQFRDELRKKLETCDERIVGLERFRWAVAGAAAVVGAAGSAISNKIFGK